ncbi:MAG: hypothetical protein Q8Q59_15955 [Luteolibacter sp.]|nr:hypothetical protein [Luteolibacter sp.]
MNAYFQLEFFDFPRCRGKGIAVFGRRRHWRGATALFQFLSGSSHHLPIDKGAILPTFRSEHPQRQVTDKQTP